jgi:hypothetical protein
MRIRNIVTSRKTPIDAVSSRKIAAEKSSFLNNSKAPWHSRHFIKRGLEPYASWVCTVSYYLSICASYRCRNETQELIQDAWRFFTVFLLSLAALSTPRIYVSALPFWTKHRSIARLYWRKSGGRIKAFEAEMKRFNAGAGLVVTCRSTNNMMSS